MMNLKSFFESRKGEVVHLRLTTSTEIEGSIVAVGDDVLGLENAQGSATIVPFNAISFMKASPEVIRELAKTS